MDLRQRLLAAGAVWLGCWGAGAQRLPGGVRPEHYSITITPELARASFTGRETIDVVLEAPASTITLNAAEITFGQVRAAPVNQGAAPTTWENASVTLDAVKQQATFAFAQPLPAGPVTLEIAYTGIINEKLRGFYLSRSKVRSYGVTQFESTDARRAFPSFDEPALKATFNVTLVLDAGDTGISNTAMVSDSPGPAAGKHTVAFATTPKMSTYLVAWLVGDFRCSQTKQDGIPIRACATPDKVGLADFALEAAKWDLRYYDKYFGIKYPMAKLDLVAIPDFEAGAMENFGCITFRETEMLVDRDKGGLEAKKEVATTVAHEIAHQWFGDLVTPAWWDDIWLNEGFATWMETKASAEWQPRWGFAEDAAIAKDRTMADDARPTTRAIRTQAETPQQIDELFDDIAYDKAGAVIAMVENWVGADVFRKGVQAYLTAHAYGNATGEDFWKAQTQVSGKPVDEVLRSFVDQPGVPLVRMGETSEAVTQRRFLPADAATSNTEQQAWTIPLCYSGAPCTLLKPGLATFAPAQLIDGNGGNEGYYRTEYAPTVLKQVELHAETALSTVERIGLVGDQWALVQTERGNVGDFLDLLLAIKQDSSPKVITLALDKLAVIDEKIASDEDRIRLEAIVRRELGPVYAALGTSKHEAVDRAQLREQLFEALGRAKDPAILAEADEVTRELFAKKKSSDPVIADAAVSLASTHGDLAMYDALVKVADNAADPDLQAAALHALTRFEAPELVQRTLDYAVSDAVRGQDSWTLIALLLERHETQDQAWAFINDHWKQVVSKGSVMSGTRIVEAAGAFCTVSKRDSAARFFREQPLGSSPRTLHNTLNQIEACIQLRADQQPKLHTWLQSQP